MDKRKKQRRKRRAFTPEFKAEAVRLCKVGDRTVTQVAVDLDLTETALREWVKRADIDAGNGPPGALTSDERAELTQLRRENKRLQMEREILKNDLPRRRVSCSTRNSRSSSVTLPWKSDRLLFGAA
ncbi:MAG TPA: transposase [Polyangiaceae bacterium]